jgi:hypothetical protein
MKFMTFVMSDSTKWAEVAQASDKNSKIPGQKMLAQYLCLGKAFDGMPPNTTVAISIRESESAEALAAALYNLALTGATVWAVPVMEMLVGSTVAEVKKLQT